MKSVTVSGTTYRPGGVLVKDSALTPDFVEIVDILLIGADSLCVFMCKRFITDCYNHHFHAFEVAQSEEVVVVEQSSLFDFHVLSQYKLRTHPDVVFISMKYHIVENV